MVIKEVFVLTCGQNMLSTQLVGFLFLAQGAGNHGYIRTLGRRDLHTHVAQAAQAYYGNLVAFLDLPASQR